MDTDPIKSYSFDLTRICEKPKAQKEEVLQRWSRHKHFVVCQRILVVENLLLDRKRSYTIHMHNSAFVAKI